MIMMHEFPRAYPPLASASTCDRATNPATPPDTKARVQRSAFLAALLAAALLLPALPRYATAQLSCCAEGPLGPSSQNCNVIWIADDQIAACPGSDSVNVNVAGHPSWLRIQVHYEDNICNFRVGVPPESIWVTYKTLSGNLVLNDKGRKVFADDSTDVNGDTRITLKSFSGCGTMRCSLFVSNKASGYKDRVVRTIDPDADGRVEQVEAGTCDVNYDGINNDGTFRLPHVPDWRRNALHGTLVKRTSAPNTPATGDLSWSPSGRRLAFSVPGGGGHCVIEHVASDPAGSDNVKQFTWLPAADDYDPSWSPLGDEIAFFRDELVIYRKGIPGTAPDTSEIPIYTSSALMCCGAISPDGKTIAFSLLENAGAQYTIWTVPVAGGTPRRITAPSAYYDWYPKWSPDGQTLIFDRRTVSSGHRAAYTVPAFQAPPPEPTPFYDVAGLHAALPSYAADGAVVTSGIGPVISATTANTLDATGTSGFRPIANYAGYTANNTYTRLSPDGTRLAMFAKPPAVPGASAQVFAARRNMNLPPNFTSVGGQSVADSTARVPVSMLEGQYSQFTVAASDPADPVPDPLTYWAYYLQQGMAFNAGTRTFSWTPPIGTANQIFHVKFAVTTPSGGTDAIIAVISVVASLGPGGSRASIARPAVSAVSEGEGLVRFEFQGVAPKEAQLTIFDLAGRRLMRIEGRPPGLRWNGKDASGRQVTSGVYFYRLRAEGTTLFGTLLYLR